MFFHIFRLIRKFPKKPPRCRILIKVGHLCYDLTSEVFLGKLQWVEINSETFVLNLCLITYGTIHNRCWQFFTIFDIPLPHVGSFVVLFVCNFDHFLTPLPFLIADDVVYGRPLKRGECGPFFLSLPV